MKRAPPLIDLQVDFLATDGRSPAAPTQAAPILAGAREGADHRPILIRREAGDAALAALRARALAAL